MRLQLMKNLVLTVRNVHISYEMASEAKLGHPFSFGLTLNYLELTVGVRSDPDLIDVWFRQRAMPSRRDETKATP